MDSSVRVYINLCVRGGQKWTTGSFLYHSPPCFCCLFACLFETESHTGSGACWLASQASQWALWNSPASVYPILGLQVHVACAWLLHGIWIQGFTRTQQALPQSLVCILSNKSGAGLLHSKLDSWNEKWEKKKTDKELFLIWISKQCQVLGATENTSSED